ncbi:MAG: PAS domain S-box protein [Bacteroidetes bacterium]|nr:PAS domain S-box protein [Bacteroidota bacterium]
MINRFLSYWIRRPVLSGIVVCATALLTTQLLSYQRYLLMKEARQKEISKQASWTKERLQTIISYSFSSTQTLALFVERYGEPQDFDSVAKQLLSANKYIDAVELVKGGVITHIYPMQGNEPALGHNILLDSARRSGAIVAMQKKDFFISGPINLVQGGVGFISRIPIFKDDQFWGFSAVLIKLSTLMHAASIDTAGGNNFSYQLAKINTHTRQEEYFFPGKNTFSKEYSVPVELPNGEWKLYVYSDKTFNYSSVLFIGLLGLALSVMAGLFAWFTASQPSRLKQLVEEKTTLLQQSEKNYRLTLNRITDAFVALDINWCYTYMNAKAGELMDRDPQQVIGKNIWEDFKHAADPKFYAACLQAMEQQQYMYVETRYEKRGRWVENHLYPSPEGLSFFSRDITGRKKAEDALRHSNERFELISRATNDALWEWNMETGELWGNDTHQQLFGLTKNDPVPAESEWVERMHPEDRAAVVAQQEQSLASGENVFITEYRLRLHDNTYHYIYDRCYIVRDEKGKPLRMLGSMMDISEQKNAEKALREREEHLRTILENEPECIKQLGPNGEVYDINPAGLTIVEADNIDVLKNKSLVGILLPEYVAPWKELARRVFEDGEPGTFEYEIMGLKGTHRYMEMHAVPLKNAEGKIVSLLGVSRDVTQRKKAEEQIRKEKDLSDSIINSLPGIFYLFDADRKLLRWNRNFEIVSEYSAEEITKVKPIDFYEGEGRKLVQENFSRVMLDGQSEFESDFVTRTGKKIPYLFTGIRVEYEGAPCLLGTGIDITQRKRAALEVELMNEQLRQLTRHLQNIREEERKRIAREIHDDLGQQLTAMKMGVVWINKQMPTDNTAVKSRLDSITAMLDASHVSVRKILNELRTDILDNYGLTEALEWQGKQFTDTTDIPLSLHYSGDVLNVSDAVATCIFRIFQEALNNISKYAAARNAVCTVQYDEDQITFTVKDDGVGFDVELLKQKKSFGILGMKERVAALNGQFSLVTSPGNGTSITVHIPLQ